LITRIYEQKNTAAPWLPFSGVVKEQSSWKLKTEMRAKCNSQIVENSVIDINLVADIQPQTNRTPKSFHTSAGIRGEPGGSIIDAITDIHDTSTDTGIGRTEINQSHLSGEENSERARTSKLKLGSKQGGNWTKARAHKRGSASGRSSGREVPFKVIIHLGFDRGERTHIEGNSSANTNKVGGWTTRGETEVISEYSDFRVIVCALRHHEGGRGQTDTQYSEPHSAFHYLRSPLN
jgi:hypothetical protein